MTVDTFEVREDHRGRNRDDSYSDGGFEAPKTTTVTRMATTRGPIPVTVSTLEAYLGGSGGGYHWGWILERTAQVYWVRPPHSNSSMITLK